MAKDSVKYIIQAGLRYEWSMREAGAHCLNHIATMTDKEAYEFARMERLKVEREPVGNRIFIIEGLTKGVIA